MLVAVAFEADKFEVDRYVDTQLSREVEIQHWWPETSSGFGAK